MYALLGGGSTTIIRITLAPHPFVTIICLDLSPLEYFPHTFSFVRHASYPREDRLQCDLCKSITSKELPIPLQVLGDSKKNIIMLLACCCQIQCRRRWRFFHEGLISMAWLLLILTVSTSGEVRKYLIAIIRSNMKICQPVSKLTMKAFRANIKIAKVARNMILINKIILENASHFAPPLNFSIYRINALSLLTTHTYIKGVDGRVGLILFNSLSGVLDR